MTLKAFKKSDSNARNQKIVPLDKKVIFHALPTGQEKSFKRLYSPAEDYL
jgi:hypothetical protein